RAVVDHAEVQILVPLGQTQHEFPRLRITDQHAQEVRLFQRLRVLFQATSQPRRGSHPVVPHRQRTAGDVLDFQHHSVTLGGVAQLFQCKLEHIFTFHTFTPSISISTRPVRSSRSLVSRPYLST